MTRKKKKVEIKRLRIVVKPIKTARININIAVGLGFTGGSN